jgi:hypothetical protein
MFYSKDIVIIYVKVITNRIVMNDGFLMLLLNYIRIIFNETN